MLREPNGATRSGMYIYLARPGNSLVRETLLKSLSDQAALGRELEKVKQLRASRGLAGAGHSVALCDGIDRARLAGVGAPDECDLAAEVSRELRGGCRADEELHLIEAAHRSERPKIETMAVVYNSAPRSAPT